MNVVEIHDVKHLFDQSSIKDRLFISLSPENNICITFNVKMPTIQ